jgi:uncharacterized protein (UPF0333 family)
MSRLDALPPDQQAALALLLRQQKSYAEVARLLGIRELAVHDRAHAALAILAPRQARVLTAPRREEIGDFLLGQESSLNAREATRAYLESSPEARAWAHAVASELESVSDLPLKAIPPEKAPETETETEPESPHEEEEDEAHDEVDDGDASPRQAARVSPVRNEPSRPAPRREERPPRQVSLRGERTRGSGETEEWATAPALDPVRRSRGSAGSRRGGVVLLSLLLVVVIVVIVLATRGGGSHSEATHTTASTSNSKTTTTHATTSTSAASGPKVENRLTLTSRVTGNNGSATVEILSEDGKHAFYISAKGLPPSQGFFYAVWLYNSPTESKGLGRAPAVGSNGRLEGGLLLPSDAGNYHEMLLTEETTTTPTHPGPVVLSGPFALH